MLYSYVKRKVSHNSDVQILLCSCIIQFLFNILNRTSRDSCTAISIVENNFLSPQVYHLTQQKCYMMISYTWTPTYFGLKYELILFPSIMIQYVFFLTL